MIEPTSTELRIRPATPADADELFRLAGLLATSAVPERPAFDTSLAAILADRQQRLLVVGSEPGGELSGYLSGLVHPAFHANGGIGWVEELFVAERLRGSGVGRRLMAAFEEWATDAGATYCALATRRAGDFYRSIVYEESAVYFKKVLSAPPVDVSAAAASIEHMSESEVNRSAAGPEQPAQETLGATGQPGDNALQRDPEEWVSGDDPITPAQQSYLDTLARQAGEELPADLTKAEASEHIDRLQQQLGVNR